MLMETPDRQEPRAIATADKHPMLARLAAPPVRRDVTTLDMEDAKRTRAIHIRNVERPVHINGQLGARGEAQPLPDLHVIEPERHCGNSLLRKDGSRSPRPS